MAEMREAKGHGEGKRRGPISRKNVDHIEIHPEVGGGHRVEYHYAHADGFKPPAVKKFPSLAEAAEHIKGMEKGEKEPEAEPEEAEAHEPHEGGEEEEEA